MVGPHFSFGVIEVKLARRRFWCFESAYTQKQGASPLMSPYPTWNSDACACNCYIYVCMYRWCSQSIKQTRIRRKQKDRNRCASSPVRIGWSFWCHGSPYASDSFTLSDRFLFLTTGEMDRWRGWCKKYVWPTRGRRFALSLLIYFSRACRQFAYLTRIIIENLQWGVQLKVFSQTQFLCPGLTCSGLCSSNHQCMKSFVLYQFAKYGLESGFLGRKWASRPAPPILPYPTWSTDVDLRHARSIFKEWRVCAQIFWTSMHSHKYIHVCMYRTCSTSIKQNWSTSKRKDRNRCASSPVWIWRSLWCHASHCGSDRWDRSLV